MSKENIERKNKHLTLQDRRLIERLLAKKYSKKQIAEIVGCCLATVYNELKRGRYVHTVDYRDEIRYSADKAHRQYQENLSAKGIQPKILSDPDLIIALEKIMVEKQYSPAAALMEISSKKNIYNVIIHSVNTVYSAIRRGIFPNLRLDSLPDKGRHRKKKRGKVVAAKRCAAGTSIEKRPSEVRARDVFGHWEMDTVKGQQKNKRCLLVLTERTSRYEIIEPLKAATCDEVRKALNRLEKRYGSMFYDLFKSITCDNGSEFSDSESMEKALYRKGKRTTVYYCHPYCPHERGTNEVQNKLIRRFLPKGSDFDAILDKKRTKRIEAWMNNMPRKLFAGKTATDIFREHWPYAA